MKETIIEITKEQKVQHLRDLKPGDFFLYIRPEEDGPETCPLNIVLPQPCCIPDPIAEVSPGRMLCYSFTNQIVVSHREDNEVKVVKNVKITGTY